MLLESDLPIRDQAEARRTLTIDVVTVQGKLSLGDEPLAGTLWFGGRHASSGTKMESDSDGKFHGVLPREGTWPVEVEAVSPSVKAKARVEVHVGSDGLAEVEVVLPDTEVFGRVLDGDDKLIADASVEIFNEMGGSFAETDAHGAFELRGVSEGNLQVSASKSLSEGRQVSDPVFLALHGEQPVGPVELRLRKNKTLDGEVRSARGPVPGAVVDLLPLRPSMSYGQTVRTDLKGSFKGRMPDKIEAATAVVSPPGNSLKVFEVPLDGRPAILDVSPEGGELDIALSVTQEESLKEGLELMVFQNGLVLPVGVLRQWALGQGGSFRFPDSIRIPNVAPGEYRLCTFGQNDLLNKVTSGGSISEAKGGCSSGYLSAGGTLRLEQRRE
jgi:hypothetical protein